jgi:uncharacterized membrane protein
MFWFFKFFPQWLWWIMLFSGIFAALASWLPLLKPYALLLKIVGGTTIAISIFILGMLYSDNTWKQAARELEAKVAELTQQSQVVNTEIKERVIYKTQIVKQRGANTVEYITREVTKHDAGCYIPPEFVQAHNAAAEIPK